MKKQIYTLLEKVRRLTADERLKTENALPSNCYFLDDSKVLCDENASGNARYPYAQDGLTLWAYASGNVKIEESRFNIVLSAIEGNQPRICFFTGEKCENGFFPISITGAGRVPFEKNVRRFTVFSPEAAYYFTETNELLSCVRMFVDGNKNIRFSVYIENVGNTNKETYLGAYFDCHLSYAPFESFEYRWFKSSRVTEDGFELKYVDYLDRNTCFENYGVIVRENTGKRVYSTSSRSEFKGGSHYSINCSIPLQKGFFPEEKTSTDFTESGIAGDIIPLTLDSGESFEITYTLSVAEDPNVARAKTDGVSTIAVDELLYGKDEVFGKDIPAFSFRGIANSRIKNNQFNYFLKNVFRQVEFCSRAKNYAGAYIGVRDIFQQLESAISWIPSYCRKKIVEALDFIGEDGRAPRQYSYPKSSVELPEMDLREYIDQGVWIISTVYEYLCRTGDFSLLEEDCGYYKFDGQALDFSKQRDSVLDHLIRITDYLVSNLDEETNCLHILYGDWNDALDGLGKSADKTKKFGTGVSVMATLQLYDVLTKMCDVLQRVGKADICEKYIPIKNRIVDGVFRYAIVTNEKNEKKILHGWGDQYGYLVGSYADNDGKNRDGLTSNAFFVVSGMLKHNPALKRDILAAYDRLDSKYGLKTFEPYFDTSNKEVGRITQLPKGTAENGATYIHATLFGVWSLFEMGESERAWEQIFKILPLTHDFISTSPFVMPNSYVENAEKGLDGQSMNDWFTGSGTVLVKVFLRYIFGVQADLDGVTIAPCAYLPLEEMKIRLTVKNVLFVVSYKKRQREGRQFFVNGRLQESSFDETLKTGTIRFANEYLSANKQIEIEIIDG